MFLTTKLTMEQCYEELSSSVKLKLIKGKVKCVRNAKGDLEVIEFRDKGYDTEHSIWRKRIPFRITIHGIITPNQDEVEVMLNVQYGFTSLKENIVIILICILVLFFLRQYNDKSLLLYYIQVPIGLGAYAGFSYYASMYSEQAKAKEQEMLNYIINRLQLYQVG